MAIQARIAAMLLFGFLLVGLNATNQFPYVIQFKHPPMNNLCVALAALSVPVAFALLVNITKWTFLRWIALAGALLTLIIALLLTILLSIDVGSQDTLQDELAIKNQLFRVYMHEPALITSQPYTVLKQEIETPVKVKLVRKVWESN